MSPSDNPIVGDDEAVYRLRYFVPRPRPSPIPTPHIFDEPLVGFCINAEWAAHFRGVFEALDQPDTWIGTDEEIYAARQQLAEAFLVFMGECQMCCDEEIAQLQELVTLNTTIVTNIATIVTNLTTVVNNQQTTINSMTVNEINNFHNQFSQLNQQVYENNQTFYDGSPESIAPNIGATWNDAPGDTGDAALCEAVKRYVEQAIYDKTYEVNQNALIVGGVFDALVAACVAGAAPTAGISAVIGMIMAGVNLAIGVSVQAWNTSVSDPSARRKVLCCMFDGLKDQAVSQATFKAACNDCGFDVGSYESNIAALINEANQTDANYEAFLRAMNDSQGLGNVADCDCCNDVADYNIVAINDCVVTKLNDFQYRIQQTNFTLAANGDPFCGGDQRQIYVVRFKEELGRCINIIGQSQATAGYRQINCDGTEISGVGGGGGEGIFFEWFITPCPDDNTTFDTTITIACPDD